MAAKDIYHEACGRALEKDGWTITHDPLTIAVEGAKLHIDLGAERLVAAERGTERIAVEVKSFINLSPVLDLRDAAGQFIVYDLALRQSPVNADRVLYLAVRTASYDTAFQGAIGRMILKNRVVRLIVFDDETEEITLWIN